MEIVKYLLEPSIFKKPNCGESLNEATNSDLRKFLLSDSAIDFLKKLLSDGHIYTETIEANPVLSFSTGVAALQTFVSINWLGEQPPEDGALPFPENFSHLNRVEDGDSFVNNVKNIELLLLAKIILVDCVRETCDDLSVLTWGLRCCGLLVSVLDERSDILHQQSSEIVTRGESLEDSDPGVRALFHLQVARHHCLYYRVREAEKSLDKAASCVGLSVTETGALGKRTIHQVKDVAQFCLEIKTAEDDQGYQGDVIEMDREQLARDVRLEDELRLESIKFKDSERSDREKAVRLSGLQQAVLLCRYSCKVETVAVVDSLTSEEVLPYLAPVLSCPQAWALHLASLLARSKLEAKGGRTVERSMAQMETCVENIKLAPGGEVDRLRLIHVSTLPPLWEVEGSLGKLLLSLGLTKAGLEVFLKLEMFDEVIACYTLLELRHKAAEVIRQRLEEKETAKLWCLLGDATDDLECYHKALALSKNRSARAYRSIGLRSYFDKNYEECIPWLQKSLNLSSFQPLLILRLAFSAMELEDWELAAKSYRNYCSFEMDNFEAWNNLAKCYVKLGDKERAWRVMQEAVRCDFDNWKVWDNLMVLSLDVGAFNDVIRSYSRILDIKQTHMDCQVLTILSRAIIDNRPDCEGIEAGRLREKFQKFLARLTVAMPKVMILILIMFGILISILQEATAWRVFGDIIGVKASEQTEIVRRVQCYQKSLACLTGNRGWERMEEDCLQVIDTGLALMEAVSGVTGAQCLQMSSSIRMSLSSAVKLIQQGQTNVNTGEVKETLREKLQSLSSELSILTDRILQLREG